MADELTTSIEGRISYLANVLQNLVKDYAPNHLKRAVHAVAKLEGDQARIQLTVDRGEYPYQKNGSMDARAQEFGSGLKGQYGTTNYIPIVPKNREYLAFYWEVKQPNFHYLPDGRVMFRRVESPGINPYEGRGYVRVALVEFKKTVAPSLDPDIRKAVHLIISRSFGSQAPGT